MMGSFSLGHILLFALIVFIFFGAKRLPELGKSLGRAIRGFKEGLNEIEVEGRPVIEEDKNKTENSDQNKNQ